VNTLACKASKKNALGLYASALKRQQDKESKAKQAKRHAIELEDSSASEDSMSVHNLEKPIPRKKYIRAAVAMTNPRNKLVKNADGKKKNEEMDIGFLSAVKKMQLEDDFDMLDSDDDVLSWDDDEEVSFKHLTHFDNRNPKVLKSVAEIDDLLKACPGSNKLRPIGSRLDSSLLLGGHVPHVH
jgi:hypothetical protein